MGADTSPADRAASATGPATDAAEAAVPSGGTADTASEETADAPAGAPGGGVAAGVPSGEAAEEAAGEEAADVVGGTTGAAAGVAAGEAFAADGAGGAPDGRSGSHQASGPGTSSEVRRSRRFSLTRDTARPEGGGRAAAGDAPAPARQWPLLTVLCTAAAGLLIVATDPFEEAFRIGTILIGAALIGGAVLRLVVPSVGMLAVRSRFTDLVTYGLLGVLIVMLSLMAQPKPWLDIPILEDAVHFTIR
ncbi:DUF3017 domain-containing protein [Streptomyces sp. NBC_00876]|uniref:DUF3017 domain-containing protein n=1 Tax=Streptomyces sp. NBC_00876 TaxID=2975853 RepID=UPI00387027DB|nr:DUF3017 domain-containing protein [Streptomyces sp. NBC_00876]